MAGMETIKKRKGMYVYCLRQESVLTPCSCAKFRHTTEKSKDSNTCKAYIEAEFKASTSSRARRGACGGLRLE